MSSNLVPASASDAERRTKPGLRGRRRILTVVSLLLALVSGVIADSGAAFAQPPTAPCPCNSAQNPSPQGVTQGDWNDAREAADFWANHEIDFFAVNWSNARSYYVLEPNVGHGWPGQNHGRQWFGYWEPAVHRTQFIYYGGTYNDYNGVVTQMERNRGVAANRAYSTFTNRIGFTHMSSYVEYDLDYYGAARSGRNARRIVRNFITGDVYATFDHYVTFHYLGHF